MWLCGGCASPFDEQRAWLWRVDEADEAALARLGRTWAACCARAPQRFAALRSFDAARRVATVTAPWDKKVPLPVPLDDEALADLQLRAVATLLLDLLDILDEIARDGGGEGGVGLCPGDIAIWPSTGSATVVVLRPRANPELKKLVDMVARRLEHELTERRVAPAPVDRKDELLEVHRDISRYLARAVGEMARLTLGPSAPAERLMSPDERAELRVLVGTATAVDSVTATTASVEVDETKARQQHEGEEVLRERQHGFEQRRQREAFEADEREREAEHERTRSELMAKADRATDEEERAWLYDRADEPFQPRDFNEVPYERRPFDPTEHQTPRKTTEIEIYWRSSGVAAPSLIPDEPAVSYEPFHVKLRRLAEAARRRDGDAWDRAARLAFARQAVWVVLGAELKTSRKMRTLRRDIDQIHDGSCPWRPFGVYEKVVLERGPQRGNVPWVALRSELWSALEPLVDHLNEEGLSDLAEEGTIKRAESRVFEVLLGALGDAELTTTREGAPALVHTGWTLPLHPDLFPVKRATMTSPGRPGARLLSVDAIVGWPHGLHEGKSGWELLVGAPPALALRSVGGTAGTEYSKNINKSMLVG